ncbi:MAG: hypothetical protein ACTHOO_05065 [Alcanivorax sp.]
MGALVPVLTSALVTQGVGLAVNEFSRRQSQDQALEQLQERQALQQQQQAQDAALQKQQIALSAAQNEDERKAALKRAVARQRASFGSQGVGSGAGSSQAVLLGMFEETEDELSRREELDNLRLNAVDLNVSQSNALNVLQRTQLQERNNLNNLTAGTRIIGSAL